MLEGVDQIAWNTLHHAHGAATDIPGLLRGLLSAGNDPWTGDDDSHPLRRLQQTIWHQGTVYSATPFAVPFLLELASSERVKCRIEIVSFLGDIASNEPLGECDLAVAKGLNLYRELLIDSAPMMRAAAGYVLSSLESEAHTVSALLRTAVTAESDALVTAGMMLCLGRTGKTDPDTIALLTGVFERSRKRVLRAAASVSLAKILGENTPHNAARFLISAADGDWFEGCFVGLPWDVYAGFELVELTEALGPVPASRAIAKRLMALQAGEGELGFVIQELIRLAFSSPADLRKPSPRTEFSDDQRAVLRAIIDCNVGWRSTSLFAFFLFDAGLPMLRWQLAERIGEPARCPRPSMLDDTGAPRRRLNNNTLRVGERVFEANHGVGTITHFGDGKEVLVDFDSEGPGRFSREMAAFFSI